MIRNQRGFALVITLIVTALLVALLTEFITEVYVDTSATQRYIDAQKAGLMAESGISGAIAMLQFSLPLKTYTSLQDIWAKPIEFPEEQGSLRIIINDESARLSLNNIAGSNGTFINEADPTGSYYGTALRLFKKLKLPASDLCDTIADWIDENDLPKPGGAESQWYTARKPSFAAKNAPLDTFEELALLKGFSSDVLKEIRPFVTVYAESNVAAPVNINTAPKELLTALDERISDSLAEQIIDYRKNSPFKDKSELVRVPGMDRIATGLLSRITAKSSLFRITAEGEVNGTITIVEAVVSFADGAAKILYWREN